MSSNLQISTTDSLSEVKPNYAATQGNAGVSYPKIGWFATHTLPDVSKHTRIIGVLGPWDDPGMYGEHSLAPNADGWFMSDFLLFQHLLNGVGSSQHWLCAEGSEPA